MRQILTISLVSGCLLSSTFADETQPRIDLRFADKSVAETPDFQKHISPLMGRLGCNGRACHGSFQGAGGFRLSLFGYDFKMDHENLTKGDNPRVDLEEPAESLILQKPTLAIAHKGGKRMEPDGWQYRVFMNWLKNGAKGQDEPVKLARLEVTPSEIQFSKKGDTAQLKAIVVWADGTREDVTPLCRFQSNDEQICKIDTDGKVTAAESGDTHVVAFYDNAVVPVPVIRPVSDLVAGKYPNIPAPTQIDKLVIEKLKKLGVVQSDLSSDADFLRRVSLDIAGTLPTAKQVEEFLADTSADKRAKKIDELLETPAYAAWWTTWLCDITGNNAQRLNNVGIGRNGTQSKEWWEWLNKRIRQNMPYDQIVEGLFAGVTRKPGQSFEEFSEEMSAMYRDGAEKTFADLDHMPYFWARNNFRTPNDRALGFAYSFLGIRIQCAECHKHPFDQWSQDDFKQFTAFFAQNRVTYGQPERSEYTKLLESLKIEGRNQNQMRNEFARLIKEGKAVPFQEVFVQNQGNPQRNRGNNNRQRESAGPKGKLLAGEIIDLASTSDPREPLMKWMRDENNPFFAKALVNRVWAQYFNVGIVSPTDDQSLANPPSNRPLLDYLAAGFVKSGYDLKWLHREITNSRTYQLSWKSNDTNKLDERNFSRAVPRRLPAEIAYDSIRLAAASDDEIAKLHTDVTSRGIATSGGPRSTQGGNNVALQVFGKSIVESNCDCDRSNEASLLQTIFLRNDQETLSLLEGNNSWVMDTLRELAKEQGKRSRDLNDVVISEAKAEELVKEAYLRSLSRPPQEDELLRAKSFVLEASSPNAGLQGLLWALINTKEFIVNH